MKGACANSGLEGRSVHGRCPSGVGGGSSMHAIHQTYESLCCLPRPSVVDILGAGRGQYKGAGGLQS